MILKAVIDAFKRQFAFAYAAPAIIWQTLFLYIPITIVIGQSLIKVVSAEGITFTLDFYKAVINPLYAGVIFNSLVLAVITSALCLLIAYPVAYYLAFKVNKHRTLLLFFLVLPSWTNFIVQIYAWMFLLGKRGVISSVLYWLHITPEPMHFLNNMGATLIGMTYCYLPFMALPLYAVLEKIDKGLFEASADLGATRFETLKRVIMPLSFPGMAAGFMLVFVPAFGDFAIPELLGGAKQALWGSLIVSKFVTAHDMHTGSALVCVGLLYMMGFLGALYAAYWLRKRTTRMMSTVASAESPDRYYDEWSN